MQLGHPDVPILLVVSVVQLDGIEGNLLHIQNVDMLDGTTLTGYKTLYPGIIDESQVFRSGWLEKHKDKV